MDAGEGFLGGGDEAFAVRFDHRFFGPLAQARDGLAAVAAGADDFRHLFGDGLAVFHPEGIGIADGAADDGVALGGAFVGLDEDFLKDADVVELVDGKHAVGVVGLGDIDEGERGEVALEEWEIGGQAGDAFVAVDERLEVRQMDHGEKRLLEGIMDFAGLGENGVEERLDQRGDGGRQIGGFADAHGIGAEGTFR